MHIVLDNVLYMQFGCSTDGMFHSREREGESDRERERNMS